MGRSPTYEVDAVLRASADVFRDVGFHNVSVEHLIEVTGINRFALYEKFGGKEGLFYDALDFYYVVVIRRELLGPLYAEGASIEAVLAMLTAVRARNRDTSVRSGCLIVNANIELGGEDERIQKAVQTVLASFGDAIARVLENAVSAGQVNQTRSNADRVSYFVTMIQAFYSLAYLSRESADELIGWLIDEIQSWWAPSLTAESPVSA